MSVLATNNIGADDRVNTLADQGGGAGHTPPSVGRRRRHKGNNSSGEDLRDHVEGQKRVERILGSPYLENGPHLLYSLPCTSGVVVHDRATFPGVLTSVAERCAGSLRTYLCP